MAMTDKKPKREKKRPRGTLDIEVHITYDAPRTPLYDEMWRRLLRPPPPKPQEEAGNDEPSGEET
jgi:hypothetical protein